MGILEKVLPIITGNNIYFSSLLHISMSALITLDVRQLLPGRICCPGSLGCVSPRDDQNPTGSRNRGASADQRHEEQFLGKKNQEKAVLSPQALSGCKNLTGIFEPAFICNFKDFFLVSLKLSAVFVLTLGCI